MAADAQTKASALGEGVARAVAAMHVTVALVDSQFAQSLPTTVKKPAASIHGTDSWSGFQISERLWKIPLANFLEIDHPVTRDATDFSAPFDCVVFSSVISDSATPLFCGLCDAAVLLLTAGRTRRDVALRAKQILQQVDVELLGTVLVDRTFPILSLSIGGFEHTWINASTSSDSTNCDRRPFEMGRHLMRVQSRQHDRCREVTLVLPI